MSADKKPGGQYMNAGEVAALMGVGRKATSRWDADGTLPAALRTSGGHRRWLRTDVEAFKTKLEADARRATGREVSYGDI